MAQRVPTCFTCGKKGHVERDCPDEEKKRQALKSFEASQTPTTIYIANLDQRMSRKHVKKLVAKFGAPSDVDLVNGSVASCTVSFRSKDEATAAVAGLHGKVCLGKKLTVSLERIEPALVEEKIAMYQEKLERLARGDDSNPEPLTTAAGGAPSASADIKLRVYLKCKAKRDCIYDASTGEEPYQIYAEVRSAPRHGEANESITRMLAKVLGLKSVDVVIVRGFTSEDDKHIVVRNRTGMSKDQVIKRLEAAVST